MAKIYSITVGNKQIIEVDADPTLSPGVAAPLGSMAIFQNRWFEKQSNPNTGWIEIDFFPAYQQAYFKADGATVPTLVKENLISFAGIYTTDSNSQITVHATNDGLTGGQALFSAIHSPQAIALYSGANSRDAGQCSLRSITPNLKTLVFNVVKRQSPAGAGVKIYVFIWGVKA